MGGFWTEELWLKLCPPNPRVHLPFGAGAAGRGTLGSRLDTFCSSGALQPARSFPQHSHAQLSPAPPGSAARSYSVSSGVKRRRLRATSSLSALMKSAAGRRRQQGALQPERSTAVCERQRLCFPRNESQPLPFPDLEVSDGAWRVWEIRGQDN